MPTVVERRQDNTLPSIEFVCGSRVCFYPIAQSHVGWVAAGDRTLSVKVS